MALGVCQTDLILQSAIAAGLEDLRQNPDLLDYEFEGLLRDSLTKNTYGAVAVADAKDWFLKTDIPVTLNTRLDETKLPCVTVAFESSQEDFSTTGDVNYIATIPGPEQTIYYTDEFYYNTYNSSTGEMFVPVSLENVYPGMLLKSVGSRNVIHEVRDNSIVLDAGLSLTGPFRVATIKNKTVFLESLAFKDKLRISCHAPSDSIYVHYLHSAVLFVLLKYKQSLLEARGFDRTTLRSGEVFLNGSFEGNIAFTRPIFIQGYVRHYWPKVIKNPVHMLLVEITPESARLLFSSPQSLITEISINTPLPGERVETRLKRMCGTAQPNTVVEIYKDVGGESVLVAATTADAEGNWNIYDVPV